MFLRGVRTQFWGGSYITYNDGAEHVRLLEVLWCLVGEPMFIARSFAWVVDIFRQIYSISEFIHSNGGRRKCLRHEVFYTTKIFLRNASQVHGKFYTVVNYV